MVCVFCKSDTNVTNSRPKARTPSVWRRRACVQCGGQFTTTELPDYDKTLRVDSAVNKHSLPFSRDKLFLSLYKSLGHRSDALDSATGLTQTVIGRMLRPKTTPGSPLSRTIIAKTSYEVLKRYDPLAAASYKAYHQTALRK